LGVTEEKIMKKFMGYYSYKKLLLCTVCAIISHTHVSGMHRVGKIIGHVVPVPSEPSGAPVSSPEVKSVACSAEYSIAHARALRLAELSKKYTVRDRITILLGKYFYQLQTSCDSSNKALEEDLIELMKDYMKAPDFLERVYLIAGEALLDNQSGPISYNFFMYLLTYSPECIEMFKRITRCTVERSAFFIRCINEARNVMRTPGYAESIQSHYTSFKHYCEVANKNIELINQAHRISKL